MIDKKKLIFNIGLMLYTTIVLILIIAIELSDTVTYTLIGTMFLLSAISFIINKTN